MNLVSQNRSTWAGKSMAEDTSEIVWNAPAALPAITQG